MNFANILKKCIVLAHSADNEEDEMVGLHLIFNQFGFTQVFERLVHYCQDLKSTAQTK